jgi:hypothetical protein
MEVTLMDFRKVYDINVSPDDFDKWRSRYCNELFADVIKYSSLGINKKDRDASHRLQWND